MDYQMIDVLNDHLCYVVTDKKTPWHLPKHNDFMLVSKVVITHVAKSKCKMTIYIRVDWSKPPTIARGTQYRSFALNDGHLLTNISTYRKKSS